MGFEPTVEFSPHTRLENKKNKGDRWDLNPRHLGPQPNALPLSYDHHNNRGEGIRTLDLSIIGRVLYQLSYVPSLVRPAGFEPATYGLEVRCSIH